ncbi:MAG: ATP-binding cassette domain-containing protein [Pyrinomonadaceae bacterium]
MQTSEGVAVNINNLSFTYKEYGNGKHEIYRGLSLKIQRKQIVALMGASGAGKSTLGRLLSGELAPQAGTIDWNPDLVDMKNRFYIDQDPAGVFFPWLTVSANVREPLKILRWSKESLIERSTEILSQFELEQLSDRFPKHLSGGQKSRLALARILAWCPRAIILDEYLADLDTLTRKKVMNILRSSVNTLGTTVIMISHATSDVAALADRCLLFGGSPAAIIADIDVNRLRAEHHFLEVQNNLDAQIAKAQYLHSQEN